MFPPQLLRRNLVPDYLKVDLILLLERVYEDAEARDQPSKVQACGAYLNLLREVYLWRACCPVNATSRLD